METYYWAKIFLTLGLVFLIVGALLLILPRIPGVNKLGRLPGDIVYRRGNFVFYFPLVTCIIISVILSLLFTLFFRR
ncbi:MAG TPA: DUF2905 domain-containing protein [Candidatus Atribacteria bacterium]|nr:DUF2905 domain-containing protein [Candidatus Atribacteria bacterium]HPU08334.1 DUF2905 domain-containing protein [Candidatus Atribacteria bacterium]HQE25131.1 DUF2905 domain-containing protein [Candidatus Atribacteria bacterium]